MEKININIASNSISGGLVNTEQDLESRLENLFISILDALRGAWDLTNSANVLLTLVFYKRILSLVEDGTIDFLTIDEQDQRILQELNQRLADNRSQAFKDLRYALINIARENPILENIFAPLVVALEHEGDLQHLVRVFWMLEELDFSTNQFPVRTFGQFFSSSLNRAAARAGKSSGYWATPRFISELLARLLAPKPGEEVYDPAAGQGSTLIELYKICPELRLIASEQDLNAWALCKMNFLMNGIYNAEVIQENALLSANMEAGLADIAIGSFPFGKKTATRQVKNRPYMAIPFDVANRTELGCNALYVQLMLHKLNDTGRMAVVLPLTALFRDRDDRKMREYLLRRDWVETVITLPSGLLYSTGAPICIVLLNKQKTKERKDKVLFINASGLKLDQNSRMSRILSSKHIDCIVEAHQLLNNACKDILEESVSLVEVDRIFEQQANLNAKRYASPYIRQLERMAKEGGMLSLFELLEEPKPAVWVNQSDKALSTLPFVGKKDVALRFGDFQLHPKQLSIFSNDEANESRLLNESALLINRKGNRLHISFFEYNGQSILIDKELMVFKVNTTRIYIDYLVLQLHTNLFFQQFQALKSDHEEEIVNEKEFLQLQIFVPELDEQNKIIKATKIELLKAEEAKVEELRNRLNLDKKEAQNRQTRIISSLHHELGNRLPAVLTEFKNLKDYLLEKTENQEQLKLEEPIFPIFEGEDPSDFTEDALGKVIKRIESMLVHTISTIDAAGNIINADKDRMSLEFCIIADFLKELCSIYASEKQFTIRIEVEEDEQGRELTLGTYIDKTQMRTAIINLIENAKRHGFTEGKKYSIRFKVGLSQDKEELIIEYKNDGKPFPESFTHQDFVSYGNYAGETGHSGIGGYLINQIMENHEGGLYYRENIHRRDPYKVQFELIFPYKEQ